MTLKNGIPVAVALAIGLLAIQYVRLLQPAQAREIAAACNGLRPAADNPSFLCPTEANPRQRCAFPTAAKEFAVQDHTGKSVSLSHYRGKVALVNFWASWCDVCKSEKAGLDALQRKFSEQGLVVLALASDRDWQPVRDALPAGSPLNVLLDPPVGSDNLGAVAKSWGLTAVPESFLVDRNGIIRHYFINRRDWNSDVAHTCIRALLDE
jgi:peroxiredoxin